MSSSQGQDLIRSYRRMVIYGVSSGFTLIELLVVIAIIGILSAIVLGSLNGASGKSSAAIIQKEMVSARQAAELYYQLNGRYSATTGSCFSGMFADTKSNMAGIVANIKSNAGGIANIDCASSGSAWSIAAKTPPGGYLCIDASDSVYSVSNATHVAYTGLFASSGNVAHLSATANTATACH